MSSNINPPPVHCSGLQVADHPSWETEFPQTEDRVNLKVEKTPEILTRVVGYSTGIPTPPAPAGRMCLKPKSPLESQPRVAILLFSVNSCTLGGPVE